MPPHLECQALAGFSYGARADRRQKGPFGNGPGSGPGRPGDSLVVWRFDRLARSVRHVLVLRRAKSGELVPVLLPAPVIAAIEGLPERYGPHYFWTGTSLRETCTK